MFCVFINERESGHLGTLPPHDPEKAKNVLEMLGYKNYRDDGTTSLDEGIGVINSVYIGAYPGVTIICDQELPSEFFRDVLGEKAKRIIELFPNATILAALLISTIGGWGYTLYERGQLVRASSGDADFGETFSMGLLLPEEIPFFEASFLQDSRRIFVYKGEELQQNQLREEFVFGLLSRIFGKRIDWGTISDRPFNYWDLEIERFVVQTRPTLTSRIKTMFSRSR